MVARTCLIVTSHVQCLVSFFYNFVFVFLQFVLTLDITCQYLSLMNIKKKITLFISHVKLNQPASHRRNWCLIPDRSIRYFWWTNLQSKVIIHKDKAVTTQLFYRVSVTYHVSKILLRKKLRADWGQEMLAIIRCRTFCLPGCYPKI